jgi:hypothetical protein
MTAIENLEFDNMVDLVMSYTNEGRTDDYTKELFTSVRDTCPSAFDKLLLISAATKDPRFNRAGAADAGMILKNFETTDNFKQDLNRFLDLMFDLDYLVEFESRVVAGDYFAKATKKFVKEYGKSSATYENIHECLACLA